MNTSLNFKQVWKHSANYQASKDIAYLWSAQLKRDPQHVRYDRLSLFVVDLTVVNFREITKFGNTVLDGVWYFFFLEWRLWCRFPLQPSGLSCSWQLHDRSDDGGTICTKNVLSQTCVCWKTISHYWPDKVSKITLIRYKILRLGHTV